VLPEHAPEVLRGAVQRTLSRNIGTSVPITLSIVSQNNE